MSAVQFEQAENGSHWSSDRKYGLTEMWPGVWWVFADRGERDREGHVMRDHIGPDHSSYDDAVAWLVNSDN